MKDKKVLAFPVPKPAAIVPPEPGDTLLTMSQVRERMPKAEDETPLFSDRWLRENVAPRKWRRIGRVRMLRASDFAAWYTRWVNNNLTSEDRGRVA